MGGGEASRTASSQRISRSVAHEEDKRARVILRCRIPIPQQDGIHHKPGLALAKQDVTECLRHQVLPRKPDEDGYWIDTLADERNRVGDGSCTINLREIVAALFPHHRLKRRRKLAAVVEQIYMEEQEWTSHVIVLFDLISLLVSCLD